METPTGLLLPPDVAAFFAAYGNKKVTKKAHRTRLGNAIMRDLTTTYGSDGASARAIDTVIIERNNNDYGIATPPPWRDANDWIRALYFQKAVEAFGNSYAITFNLSPDLTQRALDDDKGFLDYIRRGIKRVLERKLGKSVEFWIALETVVKGSRRGSFSIREGRPHIHGVFAIEDRERKAARTALHTLNRTSSPVFKKARAVTIKPIYDGQKWASYCTKFIVQVPFHLSDTAKLSRTNGIGRKATQLYEADRKLVADHIKEMRKCQAER